MILGKGFLVKGRGKSSAGREEERTKPQELSTLSSSPRDSSNGNLGVRF